MAAFDKLEKNGKWMATYYDYIETEDWLYDDDITNESIDDTIIETLKLLTSCLTLLRERRNSS